MRSCWLHVRDGQKSVTAQRSTHPPPSLTPDQIRHILEGACLLAIPINGEGLVHKGLGHKVTHNATVIQCHPGPIGVEDAHHPDLQGWSTTQTTSHLGQRFSRRATSKRRKEQAFNEQDGHLCRGLPCTASSQSSAPPPTGPVCLKGHSLLSAQALATGTGNEQVQSKHRPGKRSVWG